MKIVKDFVDRLYLIVDRSWASEVNEVLNNDVAVTDLFSDLGEFVEVEFWRSGLEKAQLMFLGRGKWKGRPRG